MMRTFRLYVAVAAVLIVVVAVQGLVLQHRNGSHEIEQTKTGVMGEPMTGWISDVQVYSGGGTDTWPSMVSDGDSLIVAYSRYDIGNANYTITVMKSTDGGVVWSQIGDFSPGPGDCRYPVMTVYNGELFVAFQYDLSATDHDIYCYKSSTGATGPWTSFSVRTDTNDDYHPAIAAVTIANYPGVYVVFENQRGAPDGADVLMYKSTGGTFSYLATPVGGSDPSEFTMPDICVYQEQNTPTIYIAYEKSSGGQNDIYFVRSDNGGSTWSAPYQVTSSPNDEYAPSVSVGLYYMLVSYVMWDGNPDLYAIAWNGAAFGTPQALSSGTDYEGWPEALYWLDDFYVFYAKGSTYTNGVIYMQTATGALDPSWSGPSQISDTGADADAGYRPGLAQCDRPDANIYFSVAWGDFRDGPADSNMYYTTQGCRYTVDTVPLGLTYQVDDVTYSSERIFNWPAGFQHTLTASASGYTFLRWDDGTNQWYTPTITLDALTNDVAMLAYYFDPAIPEYSSLILPVMGIVCFILLSSARRLRSHSG